MLARPDNPIWTPQACPGISGSKRINASGDGAASNEGSDDAGEDCADAELEGPGPDARYNRLIGFVSLFFS